MLIIANREDFISLKNWVTKVKVFTPRTFIEKKRSQEILLNCPFKTDKT
jgi:hypothetical protein